MSVVISVHRIIETTAKKFERECIKSLSQLPDKTCLPLVSLLHLH